MLTKQSRIADKGGSPIWGVGWKLIIPHRRTVTCYEMSQRLWDGMNSLARPEHLESFFLYDCEAWGLTVRKIGYIDWGIFENKVARRIFEPKREEVINGWRKNTVFSFLIVVVRKILLE
jgi:hypothetical protein